MKPKIFRTEKKKIIFISLIVLLLLVISIITILAMGTIIDKNGGKLDISSFIPKWIVSRAGEKETKAIEENVTNIDLTSLITGSDTNHTHIYERRYDSNYHWEQCWMCNDIINKRSHSIVVNGQEGCASGLGNQTRICTDGCGYTETLPKKGHTEPDTWDGTSYDQHCHYKYCRECGNWTNSGTCVDANGNILGGCTTAGTCIVCGGTYSSSGKHGQLSGGSCGICGTSFASYWRDSYEIVNEKTIRQTWVVEPKSGVSLDMSAGVGSYAAGSGSYWEHRVENCYESGGRIYVTTISTANDEAPAVSIDLHFGLGSWYINGEYQSGTVFGITGVSPDNSKPTRNNVTSSGNGSVGSFSTKATVTATYTDTWNPQNNIVYMRLLDKDKSTVISDWGAASRNGNTYTRTFDVTAEIREASNVYVQARDACGNSTNIDDGAVMVQYIDTLAPQLKEGQASSTEWSKSKKVTYKVLDQGIGGVQVAFNDINKLETTIKDNDTYSKTYNFTGDVYGDIYGALYVKDALGNTITNRVKISNIDNTVPTITNVNETVAGNKCYATLSVVANDENQTLKALNKAYVGSGIAGYAITTRNEVPSEFQSSNSFNVIENGTYYLWAKDAVGNISEAKEMLVQDLPNKIKLKIDNKDIETKNIIQSNAGFTIYEWSNTENRYVEYTNKLDGQKVGMTRVEDKSYISSDWILYTDDNQGKIRVIQTQAPNGYYGDYNNGGKVNYDAEVTDETNMQTMGLGVCYNKRVKGIINLSKIDIETNKSLTQGDATLSGAMYGLYAAEDIYHQDGVIGRIYSKDQLVQTKATENGKLVYDNVEIGNYYIKEIETPKGYLLSSEKHDVSINYEGEEVEYTTKNVVAREKVKKQAFKIQKVKISNNTEISPLANAGFKIYLIKDLEGVKNGNIKADGKGEYDENDFARYDFTKEQTALDYSRNSEGERILELFTDQEGQIISPELAYGKYIVIESTVPKDMVRIQPFIVTIDEDNRTAQNWRYFIDKDFEAKVKIIKKDKQTGETVLNKNAKYRIWSITENKYVEQSITYQTTITYGTEENPYQTNANGEFITPLKLKVGEYELREIKAPDGYILSGYEAKFEQGKYIEQPKSAIKFAITTDAVYYEDTEKEEFIIDVIQYNDEFLGELEITKIGEQLVGASINDDGKLETKYEERGIEGAEFEIYAKENIYSQADGRRIICEKNKLVKKITSNSEGKAYLENLPIGKYYVKEVKAGEGFIINTEIKEFEIVYQGETTPVQKIEMTYKNERQKVDLNKNEEDENGKISGGLEVEKIADKTVYKSGEEIIYTVKVTNTTQYTARNIRITETIPGKFENIQTNNITRTKDNLVEIKELKAGESVELKFTLPVKPLESLSSETKEKLENEKVKVENNIKVTGNIETPTGIKGITGTGTEDAYVTNKHLVVVKEALKNEYAIGEKVQYVIKVINNGNVDIEDIVLEEKTEGGKFVYIEEANKNGVEVKLENQKIQINKIEPGETVTIGYEYTIAEDTKLKEDNGKLTLENKVTVKGSEDKGEGKKVLDDDSTEKIEIKTRGEEENKLGIIKQDLETGEGLEGAVIGLYTAEDIKGQNGIILIPKDTLVEKVTTNVIGKAIYTVDIPLGKYYIKEIEAPIGYQKTEEKIEIDASYSEQDVGTISINKILLNKSRGAKVAKENEKGEFLSGAMLQVIDERGKIIDTWKTTQGVHKVGKLEIGKTYKLREIEPAKGYTTAEEIEFKIDEEENAYYFKKEAQTGLTVKEYNKTEKIEMVDQKTKLKIEILDPETGEVKEGVKVEIIDPETGEIVYEYESKKDNQIIEGLPIGKYEVILIGKEDKDNVTVIKDVEVKDSSEMQELKLKPRLNITVEKTISSISIDGKNIEISNGQLTKLELKPSQVKKSKIIAQYNIKVTNNEDITRTAKVLELIPDGYEVVDNPGYWKETKDGILKAEVPLKAGESKDLSISLRWINSEDNLMSIKNTAKLENVENGTNYTYANTEDDISSATIVMGIKTGYNASTIVIVILIIAFIICTTIIIWVILKKDRGPDIKKIRCLMK